MNVEQRQTAVDPQTKPRDLGCESACRELSSTTTIAIYYYYSARKLILIYHPTEGRRLSWPNMSNRWYVPKLTGCGRALVISEPRTANLVDSDSGGLRGHLANHSSGLLFTLCDKLSGAVYCYRSCLCVCNGWAGGHCLWVCYHDNSKLRASVFKLGL